jgi:hypothetical protein
MICIMQLEIEYQITGEKNGRKRSCQASEGR